MKAAHTSTLRESVFFALALGVIGLMLTGAVFAVRSQGTARDGRIISESENPAGIVATSIRSERPTFESRVIFRLTGETGARYATIVPVSFPGFSTLGLVIFGASGEVESIKSLGSTGYLPRSDLDLILSRSLDGGLPEQALSNNAWLPVAGRGFIDTGNIAGPVNAISDAIRDAQGKGGR